MCDFGKDSSVREEPWYRSLTEETIRIKQDKKELVEKMGVACKRETRMSRASLVILAIGMFILLNVSLATLPAFSIFVWVTIWLGSIGGTLYYYAKHRRLSKMLLTHLSDRI